jgi:hypothetical protein
VVSAVIGVAVISLMVLVGVCATACVRAHWNSPKQPLRRLGILPPHGPNGQH